MKRLAGQVAQSDHAVAGRVDDLGDCPGRRDLEGVMAGLARHVNIASGVYGDAVRAINDMTLPAGRVDDLGDNLGAGPTGSPGRDGQ